MGWRLTNKGALKGEESRGGSLFSTSPPTSSHFFFLHDFFGCPKGRDACYIGEVWGVNESHNLGALCLLFVMTSNVSSLFALNIWFPGCFSTYLLSSYSFTFFFVCVCFLFFLSRPQANINSVSTRPVARWEEIKKQPIKNLRSFACSVVFHNLYSAMVLLCLPDKIRHFILSVLFR